jgi:hypothetical protein
MILISDSGVDYTHPALGGGFGPGHKIAQGYDFVGDVRGQFLRLDAYDVSLLTICLFFYRLIQGQILPYRIAIRLTLVTDTVPQSLGKPIIPSRIERKTLTQ